MHGSEYGEQDRKAAILYEYEIFKATKREQLLATYLWYLQVINDLKKCGYKKDNCDVNDALGCKKRAVMVTSVPLALVAEKTKVTKRKEKVVVQSEFEGSDDDDISDLKKITALLAKAFNRKKFYAKPTNNNLRTSSTNKKPKYVKFEEKKEDKRADEKKRDMSKNDDDQEIFHDTNESASENFKENHIESQIEHDESEVDHNDSEEKDHLVDKLIKKFNQNIAKLNTFEEKNNEFNEQIKVLNETNVDLLAQKEVLQEQLKVKHVVIDSYTECQAQYDKLEEERYQYMIRYSSLCDNDKQHRKKIDEQEILFEKMSHQSVEMNYNGLRLQENILEKETKFLNWKNCLDLSLDHRFGMFKTYDGNRAFLTNFVEKFLGTVQFGNNDFAVIAGYGDVVIGSMTIKKVYYVDDFEKIDSPFQQTSSLKPYVPTMILEKTIIDLEDEVVSLLEKEKANLETIESLKSKGFESSENAISESKNQSENDCQVVEKERDQMENSKVIAPGMFKFSVSQSVSPISVTKTSCDSKNVENKTKRKRRCSKHMTGNRALLTNFVEKFFVTVRFGNNDFAVIAGYGDVVSGSMTIKKVYNAEGLGHNLFSVGQFCDKGLEVAFRKSTCFVRNEDGVDLLTGDRSLNLYTIALNEVALNYSTCLLAKTSFSQSWLWHQRLSHLNFATINNFVKNNLVQGLPKMKFENLLSCNNSHHVDSRSAYACNDAMNVSCNSRLYDSCNLNDLFVFDDVSIRKSQVSKMSFRKKPRDSLNMCSKRKTNKSLPKTFLGTVRFGNNDFMVIAGYRDVVIGSMTIKKVYYVNDLLTGDRSSNLYTIALNEITSNSLSCLLAKASSSQSWLWHQRLSHLNFTTINNLVKNNLVRGLPKMKFKKNHLCFACEQGKIQQKHHKSKTAFASDKPLYLLHMVLCGFMRVKSINGKRYVLVVVDDYSRENQTSSSFMYSDVDVIFSMIMMMLEKLKAKRDIGVSVGYSKESDALRIYNKRTCKIHESVNVNFDEIPEMASKQFSLEPGLSKLNETEKSSNPKVSKVLETLKNDLEDLFYNFYDEYFGASKIPRSPTTNVETSNDEISSHEEEVFHESSESFQEESSSSSLNDNVQ
nr:integrase, catalytic region, zinc finger, CCHC-type, peptidase aspartic, catalytic [Tanacetum cinerariifolium]